MKPAFFLVVSLSCLLVVAPCSAKRRRPAAKQPAQQEQPAVQLAPPPPTLAQMPASAPEVSFQAGQLTISAQNSTLGDILKAVRAQTGATIELPGNAPERVVGHFGPAPARDVLASLLNGSHFNYLLLGSPTDPAALDRVILIAKSSSSAGSNAQPQEAVQQANAYNQNAFARPPVPAAAGGNTVVVEGQDAQDGQDDTADDATDAGDDAQADDQTDQTDPNDQTDDQQAADDQQTQQQTDGQQPVKTPEQLLQELQQRQQQLQQQGIQPGVPPGIPRGFPPGLVPNPGGAAQPQNN
jgi:hypothetical protein